MRVLLHTCCGPCLLYPLEVFTAENITATAYFYNPNIHPFKEFRRRLDTLKEVSEKDGIPLIVERDYDLQSFLRTVVFNERNRCALCYELRLRTTVEYAKNNGFDGFSTTLLYSRYQFHSRLVDICRQLSEHYDLPFIYRDFREGWDHGISLSKQKNLYRQPYCGCIFSERERYDNRLKKQLRKERQALENGEFHGKYNSTGNDEQK